MCVCVFALKRQSIQIKYKQWRVRTEIGHIVRVTALSSLNTSQWHPKLSPCQSFHFNGWNTDRYEADRAWKKQKEIGDFFFDRYKWFVINVSQKPIYSSISLTSVFIKVLIGVFWRASILVSVVGMNALKSPDIYCRVSRQLLSLDKYCFTCFDKYANKYLSRGPVWHG